MNTNWITKTTQVIAKDLIPDEYPQSKENIVPPIAEITTFIYVNVNDNSIGDFVNLQLQLLAVLLQQQHGEQDPIVGPNVNGVNIGKRIAPGYLKKSKKLFLEPNAPKANTIAWNVSKLFGIF